MYGIRLSCRMQRIVSIFFRIGLSKYPANVSSSIRHGTVRFLVEIWMWAKKRFQGILTSPENASRDQAMPHSSKNPLGDYQ